MHGKAGETGPDSPPRPRQEVACIFAFPTKHTPGRSVAFLNFHQPDFQRQDLDKKEPVTSVATAVETEAVKTRPQAADVIIQTDDRSDAASKRRNVFLLSEDESDDNDEGDAGDGDACTGSAPGARTSFSCNLAYGSASEDEGIKSRPSDNLVDDEADVESTDQAPDCRESDGMGSSAVGHAPDDERGQPEPVAVKLLGEGADRGEADGGGKDHGFAQCAEEAAPAADDSEVGPGVLAATAALTPDSAAPASFSPGSTAPRSTNGSVGETPTSSVATLSSPAHSAGVEGKVSRVVGLLRRFSSSRSIASPDPVDGLREPLDYDFDDA